MLSVKKITISLLSITLLFSCNSKKAIAVIEKPLLSLDTVMIGESKSTSFSIKNIGNELLQIEKFNCSCECTVPELKENTVVKPSDSINIRLTVKGYETDKGKWKQVLCTFKTNSDSIFTRLNVKYYTK